MVTSANETGLNHRRDFSQRVPRIDYPNEARFRVTSSGDKGTYLRGSAGLNRATKRSLMTSYFLEGKQSIPLTLEDVRALLEDGCLQANDRLEGSRNRRSYVFASFPSWSKAHEPTWFQFHRRIPIRRPCHRRARARYRLRLPPLLPRRRRQRSLRHDLCGSRILWRR